jgi:hypothetical protein
VAVTSIAGSSAVTISVPVAIAAAVPITVTAAIAVAIAAAPATLGECGTDFNLKGLVVERE